MCAGDTAIEKSITEDGTIVDDVDGWNVQHECRDYSAIVHFAADNRVDNQTGIGT
jgi:hypothetical protein